MLKHFYLGCILPKQTGVWHLKCRPERGNLSIYLKNKMLFSCNIANIGSNIFDPYKEQKVFWPVKFF